MKLSEILFISVAAIYVMWLFVQAVQVSEPTAHRAVEMMLAK